MNKGAFLIVFLGLMLVYVTGCSKQISGDELTAEQYVKSQGYAVTARGGPIYSYQLDKSKLYGSPDSTPYMQMWGVQAEEPDRYFGQQITIYRFTVKQHPLERIYKKKTNVFIMMTGSRIIGGYSFPDAEVAGSVYSLDGRTLEEVTGMNFQDWMAMWKKKYSN
ncbi:hypothetical protein [Paenibacillus sp. RC67]|uniref:hypothetical protein n=1 Tax=Paenibacillus sp. RC67 TaxID=3039392 RepID=UPI0024ADAF46|nr:hypothetical protein [Paenibacillus sp. RC67]